MVKRDKHNLQVEPDPNWQPLADAIFSYAHANELNDGQACFQFDYKWADAPSTIELDLASRKFQLKLNDGRVFQQIPWDLRENLPRGALLAALTQKAVSTTWRHMVERFSAAVSAGKFNLFARFDSFRAPFEPIPKDHWCLYRVTNWSTGAAIAPDDRQIWNVHGYVQAAVKSGAGRKPIYDQDQINGEVRKLFRLYGRYGPDQEIRWRTRADLEERIAQYLFDSKGQTPSKSLLQDRVKKALEAVKSEFP
jgi:hypothetical protein